jgi:hypothetical protein
MVVCFGILLMFCQPQEPPKAPVSTYCQNTKYIYWSPSDTRKTKEQVDLHNRNRKAVCGG